MSRAKKRKMKAARGAGELPILRPNAAGVDIGATEIFVAVPPDRDSEPVFAFPTLKEDLHRLADWLKACRIETVAMESSGVYWIPLFQILEARGFEVAWSMRGISRTFLAADVFDCQWLRYLHAVGLLRPSFRPKNQVCVLRSLARHRDSLIQTAATHVLRMHKALDQMNLAEDRGPALAGERDARKLAALRDGRIKATEETIIKSLVGDYCREHLFTLRQSLAAYRNYQKPIAECDRKIEGQLNTFNARVDCKAKPLPAPEGTPPQGIRQRATVRFAFAPVSHFRRGSYGSAGDEYPHGSHLAG